MLKHFHILAGSPSAVLLCLALFAKGTLSFSAELQEANASANAAVSDDELSRAAGMPAASEMDYHALTEAKLSCRAKGGQSFLGSLKCEDDGKTPGLKSLIKTRFKDSMKAFTKNYYEGRVLTDLTASDGAPVSVETPICNLSAGEGFGSNDKNYKGDYCLDFSTLNVSVDFGWDGFSAHITTDTHDKRVREYAWWRGMYVQIYYHYAAEVLKEFDQQGRVQITHLPDGAVPAGPLARDAIRLQMGRDTVIREIAAIKGDSNEAAGYGKVAQTKCEGRDDAITTHACRLSMTNEHEVAQWTYLMIAEAKVRTRIDIDSQFQSMDEIVHRLSSKIEPICKDRYDVDCTFCTDRTRTNRANRCYREQMPAFLKSELSIYPVDPILPLPYDELKNASGSAQSSDPRSSPDSALAALGFLSLFARRKRKPRHGKRAAALKPELWLLAGSLAVAAWNLGCASADCTSEACQASAAPTSCPPPPGQPLDLTACDVPSGAAEGASNVGDGQHGLADIRNEYHGSEFDLKKQSSPGNLAQGPGPSGGQSRLGAGSVAGRPSNGAAGAAPLSFKSAGGMPVGAASGEAESGALSKSSAPNRSIAAVEEGGKTMTQSAGFGSASKGGGGGGKESESPFGSLFGAKSGEAANGGSATVVAFGGDAGAKDLDAYWRMGGNRSLFERVYPHKDGWMYHPASDDSGSMQPGRGTAF